MIAVRVRGLACGVFGFVALLSSLGCAGGDDAPIECGAPLLIDGGATALPPEIDAVLERRCRDCHGDPLQMFAPMPLVTWEDVQGPLPAPRDDETVYSAIAVRINDERVPMPPPGSPPLTDDERATLNRWLDRCAPPAAGD